MVSMLASGGVADSQHGCPSERFAKISGGFWETIQNGTFLEGELDLYE